MMDNVNDSFFDGQYKELWRALIPDELTVKEVEFMISHFALGPGSHVLDLMCGYGRHSLAMARKGIRATAVDNLADYIDEINLIAKKENLPVTAIRKGILDFQTTESFDLAICMGNSLNFFDASDCRKILGNIAASLKPGGGLFINTWSLAEIVLKNFTARGWSEINGHKYLSSSEFLFRPARVVSESTIVSPEGRIEHKASVDYIFTIGEMESLLTETGFTLEEVYSVPGRKKFVLGDPRAYLIARRG